MKKTMKLYKLTIEKRQSKHPSWLAGIFLFAALFLCGDWSFGQPWTNININDQTSNGTTRFNTLGDAFDAISANPNNYNSSINIRVYVNTVETKTCDTEPGKTYNIYNADDTRHSINFDYNATKLASTTRYMAILQNSTVTFGKSDGTDKTLIIRGVLQADATAADEEFYHTYNKNKTLIKVVRGGVLNINKNVEICYGDNVIWIEQQNFTYGNNLATVNMNGGVIHSATDVCVNITAGVFNMKGGYICAHYHTSGNAVPNINTSDNTYKGNRILDYNYVANKLGNNTTETAVTDFLLSYYGKTADNKLNRATAVYLHYDRDRGVAQFNMTGGAICGFHATKNIKPVYEYGSSAVSIYETAVPGAAIFSNNANTVSISNSSNPKIYACVTSYGAIRFHDIDNQTKAHTYSISGCQISYCKSNNRGSAITLEKTMDVSTSGNTITKNVAKTYGGAIYLASGTSLSMSGDVVQSNTSISGALGGGVYKYGNLTVSGAMNITNNKVGSTVNNVYIVNGGNKYVNIGSSGLSCSAEIGIYKDHSYTTDTNGEDYTAVAYGTAANCASAANNRFFVDDRGLYDVYHPGTTGSYTNTYLYFIEGWKNNTANTSNDVVVSGTTATVKSAAGLAYLAKQIAAGTSYTSITLNNDIDLSDHYWYPLGEKYTTCSTTTTHAFSGTFDGQGHTIKGLNSIFPCADMGLFGYSTGTIKNLILSSSLTATDATNLGGIVGELGGGTVYNCMVKATLTGGTSTGALVGKITSGSVKNSFAISNNAACGSGTVTNCYVRKASGGTASNMGTATNVGSSGSTTGTFTETVTPYLYRHDDNKVGSTALLTLLNQWVDGQSAPADLAHWTRTSASPINGDYPLLQFNGMKCVGTKSGNNDVLSYSSSLNTMLGTHNASGDNIYFWGTESGVTNGNANGNVYFDEDAALIHTSTIANAYVGVTLKDAAWHMFSPAISNAPLGINYNNDATVYPYLTPPTQYAFYPESTADGYFPSTDFSGASYYADYDYYCYYEPEYHWINFKRNTPSHWHEDLAPGHPNIEYHWDNNPGNASSLGNESTLKPGKGYLLGIKTDTYLQSHGTLNPSNGTGDVTFPVSKRSGCRTGYNLIGNPYQAYLDFNDFADVNSGSGKIWSNASSAFYLMLYGGAYHQHVYGASNNQLQAPRCLHPHQGFMVITANGSNATFQNGMRELGNAPFRDEMLVDYPLVNLVVTDDEDKSDIATIELGRPDTGGAPKSYDLHTGKGCLYVNYDDVDYAIAFTQPGVNEVAVRFNADEEAAFTMTWDMENGDFSYVHLIDNKTGADIDCLQDREYRFTANPDDYKSRFRLVLDYTGVEENENAETAEASATFAFQMNDELVVNGEGQLQMFDLTGRQVISTNTSGTQSRVMLPNIGAGMYVLRMNGKNGIKTQKIVIR
jgi:hypothetical protein